MSVHFFDPACFLFDKLDMTKQFNTVFVFIFLTFFIFNQSIKSQKLALPMQIIASIGTFSISVEDFQDRYSDYLISTSIKDNIVTRRAILNNMINEIVLLNFDDNSAIHSDPDFQKEINWSEKQTILAFLKDREIYAKINVSDNEIRDAYYKSNEKIAARHLYAETEEDANNLYQLLQTGSTFEQLARQIFTDSTLANNGGYLGFFSWGDMDPDFEDVAYSLSVGEISKPVKTRYGYSIIKLENRVGHPLLTEDEFLRRKAHMERVVKIRKKKPSEVEFINRIFDQNKIWFDEKIVGNIYDNLRYSNGNYIEKQNSDSHSSVCLKYGTRVYSKGEIEKRLSEIPLYHLERINSTDNLKSVLKGIVIQDLLFEMAKKNKYDSDPEVLSTSQKYRTNIFLKYKRKEISDNTNFPDSTVKKFYNDNLIYFMSKPRMNIQEIIVRDKNLADSIMIQVEEGKEFGILAEKFSVREWSAKNKGILGISEVDKFGILKDTLWNSPINRIVGPIKVQDYFGIFKVLNKIESSPIDYSLVKEDAKRMLKKEKSRDIMASYLNKLTDKLKIVVNEKLLSTAEIRTGN